MSYINNLAKELVSQIDSTVPENRQKIAEEIIIRVIMDSMHDKAIQEEAWHRIDP